MAAKKRVYKLFSVEAIRTIYGLGYYDGRGDKTKTKDPFVEGKRIDKMFNEHVHDIRAIQKNWSRAVQDGGTQTAQRRRADVGIAGPPRKARRR